MRRQTDHKVVPIKREEPARVGIRRCKVTAQGTWKINPEHQCIPNSGWLGGVDRGEQQQRVEGTDKTRVVGKAENKSGASLDRSRTRSYII